MMNLIYTGAMKQREHADLDYQFGFIKSFLTVNIGRRFG